MRRRWLGWLLVLVTIAACLATSVAAYKLAGYSWNQVVDYRSPYTSVGSAEASGVAAPLANRVVLVIVDGLRLDTSRRMHSVQALRAYGNSLVLTAPQPSLSHPNWTTILSGAPQPISGVTTNWYEGRVRVQTLLDSAIASGLPTVVVGPKSMQALYGAERAKASYLRDWKHGKYLSGELVTHAIALIRESDARFVVLHLPDIDEAGHASGGASEAYAQAASSVDNDVARLVAAFPDAKTTFVITTDHGHIDTGGHGGWEGEVVRVPAVFTGAGVQLGEGTGRLEDIAPTVATLLGIPVPRQSVGQVLPGVLDAPRSVTVAAQRERAAAVSDYVRLVLAPVDAKTRGQVVEAASQDPSAERLRAYEIRSTYERGKRVPQALIILAVALGVLLVIGLVSRRGFVAALFGVAAYYAVYGALFFGLHHDRWSLSSFNSEALLQSFFNMRMLESAIAGLIAALTAGLVYPLLRRSPKGPREGFGGRWAVLGPVTVLAIQATLAMQVAWFVWQYGANVTWTLPDFRWGFKYDLDLIQTTALAAAAVLGAVVTYLVGRYHPRVLRATAERVQGEQADVANSTS